MSCMPWVWCPTRLQGILPECLRCSWPEAKLCLCLIPWWCATSKSLQMSGMGTQEMHAPHTLTQFDTVGVARMFLSRYGPHSLGKRNCSTLRGRVESPPSTLRCSNTLKDQPFCAQGSATITFDCPTSCFARKNKGYPCLKHSAFSLDRTPRMAWCCSRTWLPPPV